jgi:hypothetical protein
VPAAGLGLQVQHLPAHHAGVTGGARQLQHQFGPHRGLGMGRGIAHDLEGQRQQPVAGQDRGGLVEGLVTGRPAAAQIVVVHGRQVVVHQRIAMHAFQRRPGPQRMIAARAQQLRALGQKERPQPLALAQRRIAHRLDDARRRRGAGRQAIWPSRRSMSSAISLREAAKLMVGLGGRGLDCRNRHS